MFHNTGSAMPCSRAKATAARICGAKCVGVTQLMFSAPAASSSPMMAAKRSTVIARAASPRAIEAFWQ